MACATLILFMFYHDLEIVTLSHTVVILRKQLKEMKIKKVYRYVYVLCRHTWHNNNKIYSPLRMMKYLFFRIIF